MAGRALHSGVARMVVAGEAAGAAMSPWVPRAPPPGRLSRPHCPAAVLTSPWDPFPPPPHSPLPPPSPHPPYPEPRASAVWTLAPPYLSYWPLLKGGCREEAELGPCFPPGSAGSWSGTTSGTWPARWCQVLTPQGRLCAGPPRAASPGPPPIRVTTRPDTLHGRTWAHNLLPETPRAGLQAE